jgi:hypothetical protein
MMFKYAYRLIFLISIFATMAASGCAYQQPDGSHLSPERDLSLCPYNVIARGGESSMNVWGCPNLLSTQEFDRAAKENSEEDPEEAASQEPELDPRERAKQKVLELESP